MKKHGNWYHVVATWRDGKQPVGFGVRLFYWTGGLWPWLVSLDVLLGPLDVQLGVHG